MSLAGTSPPVVGLSWFRVRLPLRESFSTATLQQIDRTFHLVRVTLVDGTVGWGETVAMSDCTYTAQSDDDVQAELVALGEQVTSAPSRQRLTNSLNHDLVELDSLGVFATSALRDALFDARLRAASTSLSSALGGGRETVSVCATVGRQPNIDALVLKVNELVDDRYGQVKLKIAPDWHDEPVAAVQSSFPWLVVHVDANESFQHLSDESTSVFRSLAARGVASIEQPFAAGDLSSHAHLRRVVPDLQVVLDESVHSPGDIVGVATVGAADGVVVKPGIVGGVQCAAAVIDSASRLGLGVRIGGMLETSLGRAGLVGLASRVDVSTSGDVSPASRWFDTDIAPGLERDTAGDLLVPLTPGWGVDVDLQRVGVELIARHDVLGA